MVVRVQYQLLAVHLKHMQVAVVAVALVQGHLLQPLAVLVVVKADLMRVHQTQEHRVKMQVQTLAAVVVVRLGVAHKMVATAVQVLLF
jgi:hypothetical protein